MDETGKCFFFSKIIWRSKTTFVSFPLLSAHFIISPKVELDDDLQQHVTDVMEQFERDTELIFRKFYQKCDQSGYHIEREKFMSLVTER